MTTQRTLEKLSDALTARLLAETAADPRVEVRAINRLYDVCVDAGMAMHEPNETAWASARVARWLMAA